MAGKGETGDLQRSHGAHPERTGQAQNGRVTSRLPRVGISLCKRGETGNRHRAPLYGDCLYGGFCTRNSCFIIFATVGYKKGKPSN